MRWIGLAILLTLCRFADRAADPQFAYRWPSRTATIGGRTAVAP